MQKGRTDAASGGRPRTATHAWIDELGAYGVVCLGVACDSAPVGTLLPGYSGGGSGGHERLCGWSA